MWYLYGTTKVVLQNRIWYFIMGLQLIGGTPNMPTRFRELLENLSPEDAQKLFDWICNTLRDTDIVVAILDTIDPKGTIDRREL
jgi:hypothetical protein